VEKEVTNERGAAGVEGEKSGEGVSEKLFGVH